jgi:hypothetical protein
MRRLQYFQLIFTFLISSRRNGCQNGRQFFTRVSTRKPNAWWAEGNNKKALHYPQTLNMLSNELIRRPSILYLWEINFEKKILRPSCELWLGRGRRRKEIVSFSSLLLPLKSRPWNCSVFKVIGYPEEIWDWTI